jgi:hypothetical protein
MRYIAFSAFSDTYLDNEEETKSLLASHLKNSTNPFVTIELKFKVNLSYQTEDGTKYNKLYKINLINYLKDSLTHVVFTKCSNIEGTYSPELFLKILPQVKASQFR